MKIRDCMTAHVVCVGAEEPAETAARLMARYNLGLLPVRGADGRMWRFTVPRVEVRVEMVREEAANPSAL